MEETSCTELGSGRESTGEKNALCSFFSPNFFGFLNFIFFHKVFFTLKN